ncbi:MAG: Hsp20/alpha crystallin family protein [Verrucomicrobia bacterium]|nr:Hsp20/alpha crystallin family protein [Verrucomicrobiota bacterium]
MAANHIYMASAFIRCAGSEPTGGSNGAWSPPVDAYLTERAFVVKAELAGVRKEDLELVVEGGLLRIRGRRYDDCREGQCRFSIVEIDYGLFERAVALPPECDPTRAKASYADGFLRVEVPIRKREPAPPQRVPVESGE